MRKSPWLLYFAIAVSIVGTSASAADDFNIVIEREPAQGRLVPGRLIVNGQQIGVTYENIDRQILPGTFNGVLRYFSQKNFVQGPLGKLGEQGDFLIEVSKVPGKSDILRSDILLHGGNKPKQSDGCILLGPVGRDPSTLEPTVGPNHPLRRLRRLFYGTDDPMSTPDKRISITVKSATGQ